MDKYFEVMRKEVPFGCSPIPNQLLEEPIKGNDALEFNGFIMVVFAYAWQEMIATNGKSKWKIKSELLKKQNGFTNNKCRKYFVRAKALGLITDVEEKQENHMIATVNPKAFFKKEDRI